VEVNDGVLNPSEEGSSEDQEIGEVGGEATRGGSLSSRGEGREAEVKWGFRETVEVRGGNWDGGMQSFKIKLKVFSKPFIGRGRESCIPRSC
jgi:hypothetical protein